MQAEQSGGFAVSGTKYPRGPTSDEALKAVIDRWGDKAVNKEYERVRSK